MTLLDRKRSTTMITVTDARKNYGDFAALDDVTPRHPRGLAHRAARARAARASRRCCARSPGSSSSTAASSSSAGATSPGCAPQKRGIGFVFQHYAAFKHMTVRDNVAFGLTIRKRPKAEIAAQGRRPARDRRARRVPAPLPGPALRRPAPADGAGPGPRRRPRGAAARRAVRRPRRQGARRPAARGCAGCTTRST